MPVGAYLYWQCGQIVSTMRLAPDPHHGHRLPAWDCRERPTWETQE